MWVCKFFGDFFMALGFTLFCGAIVVALFFDGQVEGVSTLWFLLPSCAFAWLRGEIYHWPKS